MKLPKNLTIMGLRVRVVQSKLPEDTLGLCHVLERKIEISDKLTDAKQIKLVLIHEVFHFILGAAGHNQHIKSKVEEALCIQMEASIEDLVKIWNL